MPAYFGGLGKVLPEYYLCDFALCLGTRTIIYLLLQVLIRIIVRILPNILGLIVDSSVKIILVVGIIYRYLDYPSPSFDSSNLLT
jgi:hypothetical protein